MFKNGGEILTACSKGAPFLFPLIVSGLGFRQYSLLAYGFKAFCAAASAFMAVLRTQL
jgi:hypothetical protein